MPLITVTRGKYGAIDIWEFDIIDKTVIVLLRFVLMLKVRKLI